MYSRHAKQNLRQTNFKTVLLCLTYSSISVGLVMLNKLLAITLQAPSLVATVQMAIAVVIMTATSYQALFKADHKQILTWMIVPVLYAGMLVSSFYTFEFISLSLATIMRNLTPLIVLPIETLIMPSDKRPAVNKAIISSMLLMLCGGIIYCGAITFSPIGIAFAVLNMVIGVAFRLSQRWLLTNRCQGLSSAVCSILNNGMAMLPTCALACWTREVDTANGMNLANPSILGMWFLSGLVGMGISYFGVECQREVSTTSFCVLQSFSDIATVSIGIFIFGDTLSSPFSMLGLLMSLGGSFWYGQAHSDLASQGKDTLQVSGRKDMSKALLKV
jgi:drug/metabolite transporter (DMT)-like permease